MIYIKSMENDTIKEVNKLKQKKYRDKNKLFLAEGLKFLDYSLGATMLFLREDLENIEEVQNKISNFSCKKFVLTKNIFEKISSQEHSQGIIIVYEKKDEVLNLASDIVVLDEVSDPGNLGTIIRLVDAVGLKDMIIVRGSVDAYSEKVVRSSMGSIFNVNLIFMDRKKTIEFLKEKSYHIYVTNLNKNSLPYSKIKKYEKNAFVFGNEAKGVSQDFINEADDNVIIPIYGGAESLNVAMATGIILYKFRELMGD